MLKPVKDLQEILNRSAELAARLRLAEEHAQRLQEENQKLKALQPENQRLSERVVLLEEEVRWFKEQFFGRSSQKSGAELSSEQKMLFNEAEVLAGLRRLRLPMPRARPRSQRMSVRPIPEAVRRSRRICLARTSCTTCPMPRSTASMRVCAGR